MNKTKMIFKISLYHSIIFLQCETNSLHSFSPHFVLPLINCWLLLKGQMRVENREEGASLWIKM